MGLTFFGQTPETVTQSRVNLFSQLHQIVFYGKGGYDWHTVYNMPIWLRNFTFHQINDYYIKENEEYKKAQKGQGGRTVISSDGTINKPAFAESAKKPTYTTKASKK